MTRRALLCVAAVALVVRVSFVLALASDDGTVGTLAAHLLGDERAYDTFARQVADGELQRTRAFYQAPAYAWLLGQVYRIWPPPPDGDEDSVVPLAGVHRALFALQHLFGIATAVLTALLACRVLCARAGWLAGLMAALSGPLVFHETMLLKSSLSLLVFVVCLHLWLDVLRGAGARRAALLGLSLGLGVLLRGNMLILLAAVLASLVIPWGAARRQLRSALLVGGSALLALSPATVHNLRLGDVVLSTYQAGTNAAIGQPRSDSISDGLMYQPLRAGRGDARYEEADAIAFAEGATGRRMSGREISAWWWRWVAASVAEHPGTAAQRVALKLVHLFHGYEVPDVKSWDVMAASAPWLSTWASDLWLLGPLALLGLLALPWRRRPELVVVRGGLGVVALSLALFYVMGRYRLTALPCLWVLAAGALVAWSATVSQRVRGDRLVGWLRAAVTGRPGLGLGALALLVTLELSLPLPTYVNGEHTSLSNAASVACDLARSESDPDRAVKHRDGAVAWARKAIAIAPAFPSPRNTLVRALSLTTEQLPLRAEEAQDAAWRLLLLMDGLRTGRNVLDVLDGPLEQVQARALEVAAAPATLGGELYTAPLLAFACRAVGQALSRSLDTVELSLAMIDRSLALQPDEAFAHMQRGAILRKLGRLDEAENAYRRALEEGIDSAELRNNLGNVLRALKRFDEAVEQLEQALLLRPGDTLVQRNLERAREGR